MYQRVPFRLWEPKKDYGNLLKFTLLEFAGTAVFVFSGTVPEEVPSGSSVNIFASGAGIHNYGTYLLHPSSQFIIAAAFSLALFLVLSFTSRTSALRTLSHCVGGHINPAVTLATLIVRRTTLSRAVLYIIAQVLGAAFGSFILACVDTSGFRSATGGVNERNTIAAISRVTAIFTELILTFVLVVTVLSVTSPFRMKQPSFQLFPPFAAAAVVFVAHLILVPLDGCSINPARSFGPALVSHQWHEHWIFWVGPLGGAIIAALLFDIGSSNWEGEKGSGAAQRPLLPPTTQTSLPLTVGDAELLSPPPVKPLTASDTPLSAPLTAPVPPGSLAMETAMSGKAYPLGSLQSSHDGFQSIAGTRGGPFTLPLPELSGGGVTQPATSPASGVTAQRVEAQFDVEGRDVKPAAASGFSYLLKPEEEKVTEALETQGVSGVVPGRLQERPGEIQPEVDQPTTSK